MRIAIGALFSLLLIQGCAKQTLQVPSVTPASMEALDSNPPIYPPTRFVVMSDLHLYDNDLGTEGKAWEDHLDRDRKVIEESEEILGAAVERISSEDVDFVLVCGDMTKDGELICHQIASQYLAKLEAQGKSVYIISS